MSFAGLRLDLVSRSADFLAMLSTRQVQAYVRRRMPFHVIDETGSPETGAAIYTLADPADIRHVRYVGQTVAPRRRYLQHVAAARLWLPDNDEAWWWVPTRFRETYQWVRKLHVEHGRLPLMVITRWVEPGTARACERSLILDCLERDMQLLNSEAVRLHAQPRLI